MLYNVFWVENWGVWILMSSLPRVRSSVLMFLFLSQGSRYVFAFRNPPRTRGKSALYILKFYGLSAEITILLRSSYWFMLRVACCGLRICVLRVACMCVVCMRVVCMCVACMRVCVCACVCVLYLRWSKNTLRPTFPQPRYLSALCNILILLVINTLHTPILRFDYFYDLVSRSTLVVLLLLSDIHLYSQREVHLQARVYLVKLNDIPFPKERLPLLPSIASHETPWLFWRS